MKTKFIAEIGINHNGDIRIAKQMLDLCKLAGIEYAKLQKRNPDLCVPESQKNIIKDTPWGKITYLQYKYELEFNEKEYDELYLYADKLGIKLFTSVWDLDSVQFIKKYTSIVKVPSALITDIKLLEACRDNFDTFMISTGMSTQEEIDIAIDLGNPDIVFHTNSSYPTDIEEVNLGYLTYLKKHFSNKSIGYSSHYYGISDALMALSLGAEWIEKHITLDRNMWGSDQKSALEPRGLFELIQKIKECELMLEGNKPRIILNSEIPKRNSLKT
jgi:N-acetylneuraminate synthase